VDVGANMGLTTILASKTGLTSRIVAFEPTHRYAEVWHRNITRNGVDNATLYQCAISDRAGTMRFVVNSESPLNNRLLLGNTLSRYEPVPRDKTATETVTVARLDEMLPACGIDQVQLLKVDVEGAEPGVLRGAEELLSRGAIRKMLLEFIPEFMQEMSEPIDRYVEFLISYGFRFRGIEADGSLQRILSKDDLMHRRFNGLNIVAELNE
jgi:FkbM family methyltransferase